MNVRSAISRDGGDTVVVRSGFLRDGGDAVVVRNGFCVAAVIFWLSGVLCSPPVGMRLSETVFCVTVVIQWLSETFF